MFGTTQSYFGLEGRNAIVTGAARGIGRAIAETLAGCGATVIVSDLDPARCADAVDAINAAGGTAHAMALDIGDQKAIEAGFASVAELFDGKLDILVNNAGMMSVVPLFEDRMDIWDRSYAINVRGTFLCAREGAALMRKRGKGGRIINISSASALRPVLDGIAPYSTTKGAINTMTQSLCYELAPDGITVNAVMPHAIHHADVTKQYEEANMPIAGGAALDVKRYRTPHQGEPQDIASLVAFLAGPGGVYISGQQIMVDGGYMLT